VLGSGAWGTALAVALAHHGGSTCLWGHRPEVMARLRAERENRARLPGVPLPENLSLSSDLARAAQAPLWLIAVPSEGLAALAQQLRVLSPPALGVFWATKGLEHATARRPSEVLAAILPPAWLRGAVSGPSFAGELARGLPTALTMAGSDPDHMAPLRRWLHGERVRVYHSTDLVGVELGGALKNVLAIAAGIADGLGFGANARAALITRGLAEMTRLGCALGAEARTFAGLTGLGDLVLTATDSQSRNRRFGLAVGQGATPAEALAQVGATVEGYASCPEAMRLGQQAGIELPIMEAVHSVLYRQQSPRQAVTALFARPERAEF